MTVDQPEAAKKLVLGIKNGNQAQTLLGVTGSGKTFTMANIIAETQKPSLVIALVLIALGFLMTVLSSTTIKVWRVIRNRLAKSIPR